MTTIILSSDEIASFAYLIYPSNSFAEPENKPLILKDSQLMDLGLV